MSGCSAPGRQCLSTLPPDPLLSVLSVFYPIAAAFPVTARDRSCCVSPHRNHTGRRILPPFSRQAEISPSLRTRPCVSSAGRTPEQAHSACLSSLCFLPYQQYACIQRNYLLFFTFMQVFSAYFHPPSTRASRGLAVYSYLSIRIEITTKTARMKGYIKNGISETLATPAMLAATRSCAP